MTRSSLVLSLVALAVSNGPAFAQVEIPVVVWTCPEGSPQPIVVKSWTATPDDTHQEGALRLNYVLTNLLDRDLRSVRGSLTYLDAAGNERFGHSLQESQDIPAGADFQSTITMIGDTRMLADPSALTVMACTISVVDVDSVEQRF